MPPGYALTGGSFDLIMQGDGNLVMYSGGVPQWSSQTNGWSGAYAVMQNDGNFVIYHPGSGAIWARPGWRLRRRVEAHHAGRRQPRDLHPERRRNLAPMGGLVVTRRLSALVGIGLVVVAAIAFAVTRGDDEPEVAVNPCFTLTLVPTPASGEAFEASVEPQPGCADGELLGGQYLELRDGEDTIAYLQTPNKVLPADNEQFNAAGALVERPQRFKLPELEEGRYAVCATFTDEPEESVAAEQHEACAPVDID